MIRHSTNEGHFSETLKIYSSMLQSGLHGNNFTFPLVLKACSNLASAQAGSQLHAHLTQIGFQADVFVQTALIDMYSKCSLLGSSRQVFDEMPKRTVASWNSLIAAYCRVFCIAEAFFLFKDMFVFGFLPNSSTFISILSGSCSLDYDYRYQGMSLHGCVIKLGLTHYETPLSNSLISLYIHFGDAEGAHFIFNMIDEKSIISWTTIIGGYAGVGIVGEAFNLFNQMRQTSLSLDFIVFVNLIAACGQHGNLFLASSLHSLVLKSGFTDIEPINNSLLIMYARSSCLVSARKIFDLAHERSIFIWTSMISGYAKMGCPAEGLDLFKKLLGTDTRPTGATLAIILSVCADLGSLSMGVEIEDYILLNGLESDYQVQTSLINMFCRCGSVRKARKVFERVLNMDLVVWSSMINGYANNGMAEEAFSLFQEMQISGIKPDSAVCTSILHACNHSGFVADGLSFFLSMQKEFGIKPTLEHYTCLVDLLGRAGQLNLCLRTIEEMPIQLQAQAWGPLLSACRTYGNIEIGELVAKKMLDMNHGSSANCVLVANLYTSAGKWKEAAMARSLISDEGLIKERGWSQIEVNGSLHVFIAGDRSHVQSIEIYHKVEELTAMLIEVGCIAQPEGVLHL